MNSWFANISVNLKLGLGFGLVLILTGLLVRQELQADCLAGVWAYQAQKRLNWLEPGDVEEALNAANAIGDDRLQQQGRGRVVPDSFTHGTSAQRVRWFKTGFAEGEVDRCDTFSARSL